MCKLMGGQYQKIWNCREGRRIMNPTQSESIWKRINQEEQAKFRRPDDDEVNNSHPPILPCSTQKGKTSRKSRRGKESYALSKPLQKQSTMKQVRTIFQWDQQFEEKLFLLHFQLGNKWSTITSLLKGPKNLKENDVKNKVYSAMRRGFRKVNKFIANVKRKRNAGSSSSHKLLKEEFIVKLNAVADGCFEDRFEVKQSALALARELRRKLITLARNNNQQDENQAEDYVFQEKFLSQILIFNKNCKRRKGKRKGGKNESKDEQSEEEKDVIQIESETPIKSEEEAFLQMKEQIEKQQLVRQSMRQDNDEEPRNWQALKRRDQLPFELHRLYRQQPQGNLEASSLQDAFLRGQYQCYMQNMKESVKSPYPSINPTPTDFKNRFFNQEIIKNFSDLTVSKSSFTPSYFASPQEGEKTIKFIQSIPNLTAEAQALLNSSQIRRQMEDSTNISQRLKRSSNSQSACFERRSQQLRISVPSYLPSSAKPQQEKE